MRKIDLSPEAVQDIIGIWEYIARTNLSAADRLRDKLHDDIEALARMPGM